MKREVWYFTADDMRVIHKALYTQYNETLAFLDKLVERDKAPKLRETLHGEIDDILVLQQYIRDELVERKQTL